jgi:Leucyl-tRNA synthetase
LIRILIRNYGADAVRLFILSDSPPEKDVQWSEQGMVSSYKFIQKLWSLHCFILDKLENESQENTDEGLNRFTNQMIFKITNNLDKFSYNVIIANIYETYNFLFDLIRKKKNLKNLKENYLKILVCISPIIPHFSSECLSKFADKGVFEWPTYNKKYLNEENVKIVIQIDGKKRSLLEVKKEMNEGDLLKTVKLDKSLQKYIGNKEIKKIIFIKNKLMNILLNE